MLSTTSLRRRPALRRAVLPLAGAGAVALTAGSLLLAPAAWATPTTPPADAPSTTATPAPAAPSLQDSIEPSVVQLYIEWSGYVGIPDEAGTIWSDELSVASICTGFFVSETGQIATAGHCVDPVEGRHALVDTFLETTVAEGFLTPDEAAGMIGTAYATWPVEGLDAGSEPQRIVYAMQPKAVDGIVIEDPLAVQLVDYRSFDQGDVALLKADVTGSIPLPVTATDPGNGMAVTSVGFPGSVQSVVDASRVRASFKTGSVSSQQISELGVPRTEINADLSGGMSGGPTVDPLGNVVGVNSSKIVGDQAFNFITDASDLHDWLTAKGVTLTPENVPAPEPAPEPAAAPAPTVDDEALAIGMVVAIGASVLGAVVTVVIAVVVVVRLRRRKAQRALVTPAPLPAAPAPAMSTGAPTGTPAMAPAMAATEAQPVSVLDTTGSIGFGPATTIGTPAPAAPAGPAAPAQRPMAPVGMTGVAPAVHTGTTTGFTAPVASGPMTAGSTTSVLTAAPARHAATASAAPSCRSCGAPGTDGQRFCGSCGGQL
ncbi:trypsin-like peptidase domain-containing protein [uncultured Cellulomonas sp.]|uniref:trypsin-like peptidase domain-containing protein n=1 Tax=uncultured Cellulomonas sp. TaxID=189682 RepID=UPI00262372B7|nr:trypsin-like peptidase domain-containing protein [uncultured Cellulomonas sp.]